MLRRTAFSLGRLLGDWRFLLTFLALIGLTCWDTTSIMTRSLRYPAFMELERWATPDSVARSYGLEGHFESLDEVWETMNRMPEHAEYLFLCALCNPSISVILSGLILSQWAAGRGIRGSCAAALLLRGASRAEIFARFWLAALGAILLVRWLVCALCLLTFPIRWELLPPGYGARALRLWLLFTAAEAGIYVFFAFALRPFAAVSTQLGLMILSMLLLPGGVRRYLPSSALGNKRLWRPEESLVPLTGPALAAGALLLLSLAGSWLAFRKKEL
jgi:hypothetical protein